MSLTLRNLWRRFLSERETKPRLAKGGALKITSRGVFVQLEELEPRLVQRRRTSSTCLPMSVPRTIASACRPPTPPSRS